MNSRLLWNSHQRHKFLRAEASRDILKIIISEMAFPEVFKRYFPPRRRHVVSSEYTLDWEQCRRNVPGVPRNCTVRTCYRSKPARICVQCHSNWETDALQLFLFDDAYFWLAVMVDKEMKVAGQGWLTSRRFWPATGPY